MIWYLIGLYAAFIAGGIVGALLNPEETCPRAVKGYNCFGDDCDHRLTTLYQAKLDMAKAAEEAEKNKDKNLWGGDKHD